MARGKATGHTTADARSRSLLRSRSRSRSRNANTSISVSRSKSLKRSRTETYSAPPISSRVSIRFGDGIWYGGSVTEHQDSSKAKGDWVIVKFDDGERLSVDWRKMKEEKIARLESEEVEHQTAARFEKNSGLESGTIKSDAFGYVVFASLSSCVAFAYYVFGPDAPPTINWCEKDHERTKFVKEFWNCLSMLPWIFSSAYGAYQTVVHGAHRWVSTAYMLSLSIALGSYLFHAELTRFTQALDELPMLWLGLHSTALFYELAAYESTKPLKQHADAILIVGSALITYLYCCTDKYEQFLLPYTVVTVLTFLFLLKHIMTCESKKNRVIGLTGFISMALGALFWSVELHTCRDWLKLHALWHIGVGVATYTVIGYAGVELKGVRCGLLF